MLFVLVATLVQFWQSSELKAQQQELKLLLTNDLESNDTWAIISKLHKYSEVNEVYKISATNNKELVFDYNSYRPSFLVPKSEFQITNISSSLVIVVISGIAIEKLYIIGAFYFFTLLLVYLILIHALNSQMRVHSKELYFSFKLKQVAHDIRSPLAALNLAVNKLEKSLTKDIISQSYKRLLDISGSILNETKKSSQAFFEFTLSSFISSIESETRQYPIVIETYANTDLEKRLKVKLDLTDLTGIVLNICKNSFDAKSKNITLAFELVNKSSILFLNKKYLRIAIVDDGVGFPDSVLKGFGKKLVTTKKDGHGLGLYNSYLLINSIGGRIRIGNNKLGSYVKILIPVSLG